MKFKILKQQGAISELNPAVSVAVGGHIVVGEELVNKTIANAELVPSLRSRVLLHKNIDDSLHEMLIALPKSSCDIPHINFKSGKSFHIVHGEMVVMLFNRDGSELIPVRLKANDNNISRMVRLNEPYWHTIIPVSNHAVFIETILGPFTGNQFAPWMPDHKNEGWDAFVTRMRGVATEICI